jgi:hypothetical protein
VTNFGLVRLLDQTCSIARKGRDAVGEIYLPPASAPAPADLCDRRGSCQGRIHVYPNPLLIVKFSDRCIC